MVLLSDAPSRRRILPWVAGTVGCIVAGCVLIDEIVGVEAEQHGFDHHRHVVEEGLDCVACHLGAEDTDRPGMPVLAQCRLCHDEPEEPGALDPVAEPFDADGKWARAHFSSLSAEVVFSHGQHVQAGVDCADCHGAVGESTSLDASVAVTMAECVVCHERDGSAEEECSTCHTVVDRSWAPPSHDHGWDLAHGPIALAGVGATTDSCRLCHEERTCSACHLRNPPRDHTNAWRRRGHAAGAILDRARCSACHRDDYCQRCHESTPPSSHVGAWGGRKSRHCLACHLPWSREEGCAVCHLGTPSHNLATPLPSDHTPGMDCRQCHGLTAPLPHVDNGDSCSACHR